MGAATVDNAGCFFGRLLAQRLQRAERLLSRVADADLLLLKLAGRRHARASSVRGAEVLCPTSGVHYNFFVLEPGSGVRGEGTALESPCPARHWRNLVDGASSRSISIGFAATLLPHRLALQLDSMRVVNEPVEETIGDPRVRFRGSKCAARYKGMMPRGLGLDQ